MSCINDIPYEIMLKGASPKECEDFIRKNSDEMYHVPAGYKIRGVMLKGAKTIPIGLKGDTIYFQYVKPCTGLFVLKLDNAGDEIDKLRSEGHAD
ncbi:DUF1894 domain-containing protein [Methanohalophilus sp.]|uniref:DUF1894 domain-containing protein n=1 Tax=Methanohalophilus sp. TaxID=1966352 RepID=UPI00262A02D3|nr:DUF1894 domain-containing protein [Methanohalophilus sp.]MDK2891931.1 hypothetical protein [Methanohalophilus sp.]